MPLRVTPDPTFRDALSSTRRPLAGMWVCSGSPLVAELCAGSGLDWLLIDAEHSPNGLESILAQLQAVHGYPVEEHVNASKEADLVVLGSRGVGGFTRMMLGSTAGQVVQHAHCPVTIVPHEDRN